MYSILAYASRHPVNRRLLLFFFFNDTATTEIYTLSLHDALPIFQARAPARWPSGPAGGAPPGRSEEHTSELQSHVNLVCRLLLEKKKETNCPLEPPLQRTDGNYLLDVHHFR